MPSFTAAQKLQIKAHMGYVQDDPALDQSITFIEADTDRYNEMNTLLTSLNTTKAAYESAYDNADEITSGEGATLNHPLNIKMKKERYTVLLSNLERILGYPCFNSLLTGSQGTVGWDNGLSR